ncbi:hypothetical protein [Actinotalea sp.]|uniref:hypothetical protein n=1 Tax=Actinotalea sp. TaxID=1872145 RepID=UPI00356A843B
MASAGRAGSGGAPAPQPGGPSSPLAVRWRRPGWRDPRLLVGLVLVGVSVGLGAWAVGTAGRTVAVLAAREPLVVGRPLADQELVVREVRLADAELLYLPAATELPGDLVVTRAVGAGELVPVAALTAVADIGLREVAVDASGPLASTVVEGSLVDLWFVPEPSAEQPVPVPRELAPGLEVAQVSLPAGALAVGSGATVHVMVPVADLPAVLAALAADGSIQVVSVPAGS